MPAAFWMRLPRLPALRHLGRRVVGVKCRPLLLLDIIHSGFSFWLPDALRIAFIILVQT
jgi:hypothetical protein